MKLAISPVKTKRSERSASDPAVAAPRFLLLVCRSPVCPPVRPRVRLFVSRLTNTTDYRCEASPKKYGVYRESNISKSHGVYTIPQGKTGHKTDAGPELYQLALAGKHMVADGRAIRIQFDSSRKHPQIKRIELIGEASRA